MGARLDGVRPPRCACRRRPSTRAGEPRPGRACGSRGVDPPRPARARGPAPCRHDHPRRPGGSVTQALAPGRPRRSLRARRPRRLPGSVVMNVVPALVAGVRSFAVASPPQKDHGGLPHPTILAACAARRPRGLRRGGAQAVAMFAYGTGTGPDDCRPVADGHRPGNIYVTAAKRLLKGRIGIDPRPAHRDPAILADDTADAAFVAADPISQAEHDVIAASVLVTTSVESCRRRRGRARRPGPRDQAQRAHRRGAAPGRRAASSRRRPRRGCAWSTRTPPSTSRSTPATPARCRARPQRRRDLRRVVVAGELGDYAAGSNHVLPTGGCACHPVGACRCRRSCGHPRRRLRRGRAGRRRAARGRPRQRRGPAGPRRGRRGPHPPPAGLT